MDLDSFRSILTSSRTDIFEFINMSIKVASIDHPNELKDRRDHIVQNLFNVTCPTCHPTAEIENFREPSPITPQSNQQEPLDPFNGLFEDEEQEQEEDEETRILKIRDRLEDPNQSEESLVELLQILADMDITLKALKETDIGRHVNRLRKHPLNEVRVLVKQLVRKWKDMVDEWVKVNTPEEHTASTLNEDADSPQQPQRKAQSSHQVPDLAYSPNPYNGNNSEPELKQKAVPRREVVVRPPHSTSASASAPPKSQRQPKDSSIDADRLASARKRLQENYQDAQNARKQRKIQVMDIHEIPKPKNGYIARNKGGPQGRHR